MRVDPHRYTLDKWWLNFWFPSLRNCTRYPAGFCAIASVLQAMQANYIYIYLANLIQTTLYGSIIQILNESFCLPYLTWHTSPTTKSDTGTSSAWPPRITANLCSSSIFAWRPRNFRSFDQSLPAVIKTMTKTVPKIATPSIQLAFDSLASPEKVIKVINVQRGSNTKMFLIDG